MGLFKPSTTAYAHCDLYCGVYDPAQAKIEAMSVLKVAEKYQASDDPVFRDRAVFIKEERAEEVKHHLMVLWADFFSADHRAEFPQLDDLFWQAIHQAGEAKKSMDPEAGRKLISLIDAIAVIFWSTEKAKGMGVYPPA
ncbi:MAG TPA: superoxide dismutase, Ni [Acidimicrobiia bacterium]|nr:superoxide dismutase, Ni [Acidimicrobiia bacterium]